MGKIIIKKGTKYGRLVVIREGKTLTLPSGQKNRTIRCKCDCGKVKNIRLHHLVRNRTISCGCLTEKHGMSGGKLYRVWTAMKERCHREGYIDQHRYKDRGISICDRWNKSFTSFMKWAIKNSWEEGLQIDRINNNLGYCPKNCRFVTNKINANNREDTIVVLYNGVNIALKLILEERGLQNHYGAIYTRIKRGWGHQDAIDTGIRVGNYKKVS